MTRKVRVALLDAFEVGCFSAPPLGLITAGEQLKRLGFETELIDFQIHKHSQAIDADYVAVSFPIVNSQLVDNYIKKVKRLTAAKIIAGGKGVIPDFKHIYDRYPDVLFHSGTAHCDLGSVFSTTDHRTAPSRTDMGDDRITPLSFSHYRAGELSLYDNLILLASYNCPYTCYFCSNYLHRSSYCVRAPVTVISEIDACLRNGVRRISFGDLNFMSNPNWKDILGHVSGNKMIFGVISDLRGSGSPEDYEFCSENGMYYIIYGFETLNQKSLDETNKNLRTDDLKRNLEKIMELRRRKAYNNHIMLFLLWGMPYQTVDDIKRDVQWCLELGFDTGDLLCHIIQKNFGKAKGVEDRLIEKSGMFFDENGTLVKTDWITEEEMLVLREAQIEIARLHRLKEQNVVYKMTPEDIYP